MKKIFVLSLAAVLICDIVLAQNPPKREMRAAWLATYANIDWPANGATTAQEQSTYIQRMDEHRATGMNAVFVQIRSQCDAMYPSAIEPWSRDLTGTQGVAPNPYYDPLEFMITETRKRGMEFHAWFNPYRALASATTSNLNALHPSHIINTQPSWILDGVTGTTTQKILNPGLPQVWDYVISVVMDVVRRYDVDGIHFDDYFYPNPALTTYNDDATYLANGRGIATKAEWRRSNVDSLIRRLNDSIHSVKPWVKFGISPSGIWLSFANSPTINQSGSNTSSGATQHYKDLFCNSRLWQQQGWVDYLMPQVYWWMGQTGSDYNNLIPWWNSNAFSRHMYIGMAGYKVGDNAQGNFGTNNREFPNQIRLNRQNANISGQVIYNTTSLRNNPLGFRDSLTLFFFNKPALLPVMSWIDNTAPTAPTSLTVNQSSLGFVDLTWTNPALAVNELDKVKRIAIYRSTNAIVDITNANSLIGVTWNDTTGFRDNTVQQGTLYYYVVTTLDRLQNESTTSITASFTTLPLRLVNFSLTKNINHSLLVNWQTENEINVSHFDIERAINNFNFTPIKKVIAENKTRNNYSFNDDIIGLNNQLFYRIKMVDQDGKFSFSNTLSISGGKKTGIKVFPTMVRKGDNINIYSNSLNIIKLNYSLVDATARIVQQGVLQITGNGTISISNQLSGGVYYLILRNDKGFIDQLPITIH